MMTSKQEDEIAKILSELTPVEYSSLLKKVDRTRWDIKGHFQSVLLKENQNKKNNEVHEPTW